MENARAEGSWFERMAGLLGSVVGRWWFPAAVGAVAVLFAMPSLGVGMIVDDYYHRVILLRRPPWADVLGSPSEMFRFFTGDEARTWRIVEMGLWPWWTDPGLKASFLQALTVLTHRLDYALWPDSAPLMHAHNLFWLGTAVAAASAFYRRMLGATWVAGLAALLYALDDPRGATAGTICNRNVLIAATFGFSALAFHDRWRREGRLAWAALSTGLLTLALFSKEEGIGTCAYLGAYALFLDDRGRWRGLLALTPYLVVLVVWRALRSSWGYGVENVGLYIDPLTDPGPFAAAAVERIPILLLAQWTGVPAEIGIPLSRKAYAMVWWGAVGFLSLALLAFAPLLRRDRLAWFWAAGMVFATVPVAATFPMDRLLTFPGLGASGLLALFIQFIFERKREVRAGRGWRFVAVGLAWFFVVVHMVIGPFWLLFRAANPIGPKWIEHRFNVRDAVGPEVAGKTLVIVNAPSPAHAHYFLLQCDAEGRPAPRTIRVLAPSIPSVAVRRLDDRTLAVRPGKGYLVWVLDRVFRNERRPMALGQRVSLPGMDVEVTAMTPDGRPAEAKFRFDRPLESPDYVWLCYRKGRFVPFVPPGVGEQAEIPFDWRALFDPLTDTSRGVTDP
jgi:hypothetical protein